MSNAVSESDPAEMDGEDGIDLQALLGGAADFQEAGDGTSRHSLDLPAGFDFEASDHLLSHFSASHLSFSDCLRPGPVMLPVIPQSLSLTNTATLEMS